MENVLDTAHVVDVVYCSSRALLSSEWTPGRVLGDSAGLDSSDSAWDKD